MNEKGSIIAEIGDSAIYKGESAVPFDHVENRTLNARGNRFEVIYRSYEPIDGSYVDLIARENNSVYYKNNQGMKSTWLNCREG